MEMNFENTWFRVAGIAKRIKNLDPPPHWRFEIAGRPQQFPLHDFRFAGEGTAVNNVPGVNQHATGEDLIAWIAGYGNVMVDTAGSAVFELLEPATPCPW